MARRRFTEGAIAWKRTVAPKPGTETTEHRYIYDAWNRLVKVTDDQDATILEMEYDGRNHRLSKTDASSNVTHYYYNNKWQVIQEVKGTTVDSIYLWHPHYIDALAVRMRVTDEHHFTHDANFNITAALNPSGTVVAHPGNGANQILHRNGFP